MVEMKKTNKVLIGLAVGFMVLALVQAGNTAQFALFRDGVRPAGMGGAFVAVSDDSNAMAYNPAGLAQIAQNEFRFEHTKLFVGLDENSDISDTSINYVQPLGQRSAFGFNVFIDDQNQIRQSSYGVTGAIKLGITKPVLLGISAKSLNRSLNESEFQDTVGGDPVLDEDSSSAVGVDLGVLVNWSEGLSFGLVGQNINEPDLGFKEEDKEAATFRAGVAVNIFDGLAAFDVEFRDEEIDGDKDITIYAGYERWLMEDSLGLRAGFNNDEIAFGATYRLVEVGLGLDYAYIWHTQDIEGVSGTHMFGLNYRFGRIRAYRKEAVESYQADLIRLEGDNPWAHLARGNAYRSQGQYSDAISEYEESVRLDESFIEGYMALGQLYIYLGDNDKASEQYEKVLLVDPENTEVREVLQSLK